MKIFQLQLIHPKYILINFKSIEFKRSIEDGQQFMWSVLCEILNNFVY